MRAHRARHAGAVSDALLPVRRPRAHTVYQCPECETRFVGEQRCPECNLFCRRLGPGGTCPCCDEPVAIAELIDPEPVETFQGRPPV